MHFPTPEWHEELTSTNAALRERLAREPLLPDGFAIAARRQTAGRGRFDRRWVCGGDGDLTFSFLVRCRTPDASPSVLPMVAAVGVCRLLQSAGLKPRLKWPNDVLIEQRKICGILAECTVTPSDGQPVAVVGVGLNVNMTASEAHAIGRPATSLRIETGHTWEVEDVLRRLLRRLTAPLDQWAAHGFTGIRRAWEKNCRDAGRLVTVSGAESNLTGTVAGFGDSGELLLRDAVGVLHTVWSGDVSMGGTRPK